MPFRAQAHEILQRWRAAERAYQAAEPGSPQWLWYRDELEALRREYLETVAEARAAHAVEQPAVSMSVGSAGSAPTEES